MSFFKSGNPTLSEKYFDKSAQNLSQAQGTMTVRGAINKFAFLLLAVIAGAAFTWEQFYSGQPQTMYSLGIAGLIGGAIVALVMMFKLSWAPYLAPAYGILEGLFIGALSAIVNYSVQDKYPNIIPQAVGLTFAVALAMFLLYNFRIIKPTQKFKAIVLTASLGIGLFYLVIFIISLCGVSIPFMSFTDTSALGIGINLFVAAIAALQLILDFELIEEGAANGAPKYMEWYGAFGLLVTLVWLYIQILKLLSRFASRD